MLPGKGVRIGGNGKELYADLEGIVFREGEKVGVSAVYTVQGDVNFKTGHVRSNTAVVVTGGILSGFKVEAEQDLHVNGLVEGAELSAGGSIFIAGGIQGCEKAHIKAGGDVIVKFINNAAVDANGSVVVNGAITNSVVRAMKRISVEGSNAVILGGHAVAEEEISATAIGTEMGTKTIVEIGYETAKLAGKRAEEVKKLQSLVENYKKLQTAVESLNKLRDLGKLNPSQAELRLKIIRAGMQLQGQIKQINESVQRTDLQITHARQNQKGVVGREVIWPGVIVRILGQVCSVKYPVHKAIAALVGDQIDFLAYKADEKKEEKKKKP